MSYPGNANLSSAVKDRVVSTFQQTLALYHQRRTDEVVAGCTLILQMDPVFDPARKLLEKTRNPSLAIDVDSLLPGGGNSAMQQAREAMARRDFERVARLTSEILSDDLLNDDARVLGDEAREKLEAAPFVEQFTRRSDQSIAAGNMAAAKMELEKARALDPTHPEVIRVARLLSARDGAPAPAAVSPSFVVEEPKAPASGRSTAQAADFGFAFEEEQPPPAEVSFADFSFDTPGASADSPFSGGFSFDAPSSAASAPGNEFDFATASVVTSTDDQKKIEQFLADGDRAFAGGDYQQAVDLWSRIFLIDVTNDEASDRIEHAKAKRREVEQNVEPLLTSAIFAFDGGNNAKAQADFSEVLRLDPQNATAQDYLRRISDTSSRNAAAEAAYIPPSASDDQLEADFFADEEAAGPYAAPLVPPPPSATPRSGKTVAAPAKAKKVASARKLPVGMIAAVLGVLVLLAGGWFAWTRFSAEPEAESDGGAGQALIARAQTLAGSGKYDQAIALLQNIKPSDPQHDEALVMIADLRAKKSGAAQLVDGIPAEQFFAQHLTAARTAFDGHDYVVAKTEFEQATRVKPLPADLKAQYDAAAQQVAKLDSARALFAERRFADAITSLQPLLDQDPQNQAIRRMILDAHFNSGAVALQEERLPDAIRAFDEVLKVSPDDELAHRSRELAQRYDGEPKDLLYRIYVKYLPLRQSP
jgi:tetratricopeptide (TPR) repeat protein